MTDDDPIRRQARENLRRVYGKLPPATTPAALSALLQRFADHRPDPGEAMAQNAN